MIRKFIFILFCTCSVLGASGVFAQNANPFLDMVGKEYAEYYNRYKDTIDRYFFGDSLDHAKLMLWFNEAVEMDVGEEWLYNRKLFNIQMKSYKSRNGGFVFSPEYTAEEVAADFLSLYEEAKAKGITHIELLALFHFIEMNRIFIQDYSKAFEYYVILVERMENIPTKEFPSRPYIYCTIAGMYFHFSDYDKAIEYYQKIINDPDIHGDLQKTRCAAYNGLGLCYREGYEDYEQSDKYFHLIMQYCGEDKWIWEGIVNGNLGYNQFRQGNYDAALPLLISCIKQITSPNDYQYLIGKAVNVAEIYLQKGDLSSVKKYIDIALDYKSRTNIPQQSAKLYEVMSKYYMATSNPQLAIIYFDSAMTVTKKEHDDFSGLILRRIDQQLHDAHQQIIEKELRTQHFRSRAYLWIAVLIFCTLLITTTMLVFYRRLYQQKMEAYNQLVDKAKTWAASDSVGINIKYKKSKNATSGKLNEVTNEDKEIFDKINLKMIDEQLYLDPELSLESMSQSINVNPKALSKAINNMAEMNFNNFVNDYRIKEAVRILASPQKADYVEKLYVKVGFASRAPFYVAFKKNTGLSPAEFKSAQSVKRKKTISPLHAKY